MTSDELDRLTERALEVALAALRVAEQIAELADELERITDGIYADEQGPPLLVVRKGDE